MRSRQYLDTAAKIVQGQRQFDYWSSEMILDEGLPMRFHYRTLKGER